VSFEQGSGAAEHIEHDIAIEHGFLEDDRSSTDSLGEGTDDTGTDCRRMSAGRPPGSHSRNLSPASASSMTPMDGSFTRYVNFPRIVNAKAAVKKMSAPALPDTLSLVVRLTS